MIFNAETVDLSHFDTVIAHYDPKNIHAQAVQATEDNIGQLALEFELDLFEDMVAQYFRFDAERGIDSEPEEPRTVVVKPTNWIVALWGELHIYTDDMFRKTFRVDLQLDEVLKESAKLSEFAENDFAPHGRGLFDPVPKALADAVKKMDEQRKNEPTFVPDTTQIIPAFGKVDVEDAGNDRPQSL